MIGAGLGTAKDILEAILYGCTANTHHVLGEAVDFIVSARALLAMLKGFTMGNFGEDDAEFFTFHATELKSKSKVSFEKSKISWSKTSLLPPKEKFNFDAPDAANNLRQCWEHLTALLKKTLGAQIALEHAEVCNVLMAAHMGEEFPQVEFTVIMIYLMHRSAIGWWRACMEAFLSKSTYLHSNFGKDLLWVGQGTSFKRPRLLLRTFKDGRFQWADFLDYGFFRVARQHGKAAAAASAAKEQAKLMKCLAGVGALAGIEYTLGNCLSKGEFNNKNYQRVARKAPVLWPLETNVWVELDFATVICPFCLLLEPEQGDFCEKLVFANKTAWNYEATIAVVEAQRAGESILFCRIFTFIVLTIS